MKKLSELSKRIDGQPMFKLLDKVKKLEKEGKNIIHFEIGDPDFETPENIVDAGIDAIKNGFTHYTSSFGLKEFRQKILEEFPQARIEYDVNEKRQKMVDSWPVDIDDRAARSDWNWNPKYDLETGMKEYLIPDVKKMYS